MHSHLIPDFVTQLHSHCAEILSNFFWLLKRSVAKNIFTLPKPLVDSFHPFAHLIFPLQCFFFFCFRFLSFTSISINPCTYFVYHFSPTRSFNKSVFCAFHDIFCNEVFKATFNVSELNARDFMQRFVSNICLEAGSLTLLFNQKVSQHISRRGKWTATSMLSSTEETSLQHFTTEKIYQVLPSALVMSKYSDKDGGVSFLLPASSDKNNVTYRTPTAIRIFNCLWESKVLSLYWRARL